MREKSRLKLLGFLLAWAMVFAACVSFAQPTVTRGGALKKRAYQTYATTTLYVDPTGNDANPCTASGTSACLTLAGALAKVARFIRHAVNINVAAGTYAEVFRLQGFTLGSGVGAADAAALTISGAMANVTPTTGTATGTLTGRTAPAAGTKDIVADSTQTWTTNDFRGAFLQITGGTGSGQYRPIASNTATTISLAAPFTTAPVAGSTYAIVSPSVIFTGAGPTIRGITGAGTVTLQDIAFAPSSGAGLLITYSTLPLALTRVKTTGTLALTVTGSGALNQAGSPNISMTDAVLIATTTTGYNVPSFSTSQLSRVLVYCSGSCTGYGVAVGARSSYLATFTGTISGTWAAAVRATGSITSQSSGFWIDCPSTAMVGIQYATPSNDAANFVGMGWAQNTGPYFDGCGTGFALAAPSMTYIDDTAVFTNVTTAIALSNGARAIIDPGTTSTGVTTFLTVDGASYTAAELVSFGHIVGAKGSVAQ